MNKDPVLTFSSSGIYCSAGDFYIDPWRPVRRALITHGHADHAFFGHKYYLSTDVASPVLKHRLGQITLETLQYGEILQVGSARVSFHPAGHVPGSAQIKVEVGGEAWVVSGDYKLEDDGLSTAFDPVPCHSFVTECTFGIPVFRWQEQSKVFWEINNWWANNASNGIISVLGAYGLGKAQRLLRGLDLEIGKVLTHGAIEGTNRVMREQGIVLPETQQITPETDRKGQAGALILAPPSVLGSKWLTRFGDTSGAFASGWMGLRGVRRRRSVDRGFVISDHADWDGLNTAVSATGAENIYVTHGYTEVFSKWLKSLGYHSEVVNTRFNIEAEDVD